MRTNQLERIGERARRVSRGLNWWQTGLIAVGATFLGGLATILSGKKRVEVYTKELKQAPWAPPPWLFSPAWLTINYFVVNALARIISNDKLENRKNLLYLQTAIWAIYFSTDYLLFKKKSPVLTAIWTKADAGLAIASFILTAKKDRKLSLNYIPLALWTLFAGSVADYQALKNPDRLLKTGPALS